MVTCHCSVDSNPKAAVTWSVNGAIPTHEYNISVTSQPDKLTAVLTGNMDKPQTVICFAANIHGNDSLLLLSAGGGDFVLTKHIELHPTLRCKIHVTVCIDECGECMYI